MARPKKEAAAPAQAPDMGADWIEAIYKQIGQNDCNQDVSDWLTTGFLPLNYILSGRYQNGGFPAGRISELSGWESSGKTLIATMAMIQTQRKGGLAAMIDFEHAFSLSRAISLGLSDDPRQWIYKQPESAEKGFEIMEYICDTAAARSIKTPITIVADSVAAMKTVAELECDYDAINMKTRLSLPALLAIALKKIAAKINKTNVTLLFINQLRDKPGVIYGDKEDTTGGNSLKFYASTRVRLTKYGRVKDGDSITGENVRARVIKNKVWRPFGECEYISDFTEGINLHASHIEAAKAMGKVTTSGAWLEFAGQKWQGAANMEKALRTDPALYRALLEAFTPEDKVVIPQAHGAEFQPVMIETTEAAPAA